MSLTLRKLTLVGLGLVVGAPAVADPAEPAPDIVISAERLEKTREEARLYLGEVGVRTAGDPVARWLDPVCPHAIGLGPENTRIVEAQLRRIITDAGAPLAPPKCAANFNVVFTDSAVGVVRKVARHDARAFQLPASAVRELTSSSLPIRWWYNSEIRSRDGQSPAHLPFPPGWRVDGPSVPVEMRASRRGSLYQYGSSVLSSQVVRAISFATVVIDIKLANGLPLSSAVDFAGLAGLAEVKLGAVPRRSILSLFEPNGERQLTNRDRAFLRALYHISMDRSPHQQKEALTTLMSAAPSK